ncbi:MAG: hypothetical protein EA424_23815 [Planctomycetaceae bacterium]|nr:MAG: hypothetical protein EA424_23815 [Planctomycetaceae bacterium]
MARRTSQNGRLQLYSSAELNPSWSAGSLTPTFSASRGASDWSAVLYRFQVVLDFDVWAMDDL